MALEQWAIPRLSSLLPLEQADLTQIIAYTSTLSDEAAAEHFTQLLGDSQPAAIFISQFIEERASLQSNIQGDSKSSNFAPPPGPPPAVQTQPSTMQKDVNSSTFDPPPGPPPQDKKQSSSGVAASSSGNGIVLPPPAYTQPKSVQNGRSSVLTHRHSNPVIEAAQIRARDEQEMQQALQSLQYRYGIYNSEIEPEHDTDNYCGCPIHAYQRLKRARYGIQHQWSKAVMYPGEKAYDDSWTNPGSTGLFSNNPYANRVVSPYGYSYNRSWNWGPQRPIPEYHARSIHQTIELNNHLNQQAQANVAAQEPKHSIWDDDALEKALNGLAIGNSTATAEKGGASSGKGGPPLEKPKVSRMTSIRKSFGIKSSEERAVGKVHKSFAKANDLRDQILAEEQGRWPDDQWRQIVNFYQDKVGMSRIIADLRARNPIQYLHLLRAGYFEPIPVAWADQSSNPLKFSIEAAAGWRGITPAWRGYEDTAEERLYWVLNHREGSVGMRMKPDFISEMNMARARMATAVEPPPMYFSPNDTCHLQHTSAGYSKQVMPSPFRPFDQPEKPTDDTMILLDVSGSMDFDPVRPLYDQYLITDYVKSTQPKNKDVAKAIIRRFTDAMANHDHQFSGYDLTTFSTHAKYIGSINSRNFDHMWQNVRLGGGTRVMTGWQKVKDLHFRKHHESATHHPVYGWQAGPETPILRLLLLLDGEATDMDEFELDLLGLSWAHVTIFLIGVDGCPHHHRHANELQRISDVNHHVSFVDAQGNCPERFVTHELLKRHLGYEVSMQEFEAMEELPPYEE